MKKHNTLNITCDVYLVEAYDYQFDFFDNFKDALQRFKDSVKYECRVPYDQRSDEPTYLSGYDGPKTYEMFNKLATDEFYDLDLDEQIELRNESDENFYPIFKVDYNELTEPIYNSMNTILDEVINAALLIYDENQLIYPVRNLYDALIYTLDICGYKGESDDKWIESLNLDTRTNELVSELPTWYPRQSYTNFPICEVMEKLLNWCCETYKELEDDRLKF